MQTQNKKQNYHIISLIGQGAYGHVYKARRRYTGQFVAIKSIKKKGKQQKDIKVMRDQIQILKKLKHQNIILLLDSFQTASQFILVTQLGQGELFNIIQDDQSLQESQIRKIAQQLVRALHYIHSNRITHRDMKPQNILMTSDGIIKLCDFGFARHMSYKTQILTSLKGTPLYMAPEVVKEEPYNHTADLWSLGVILYELSTGNPPFTASNLISLVEKISNDEIEYPKFIAGQFKSFLKGLLNKNPKKRLGWPQLLSHPFIKETQQQKQQRKKKTQKFSNWVEDNHYKKDQEQTSVIGGTIYARSASQHAFDERSRDISPKKQQNSNSTCNDALWNKFLTASSEEKGANALRVDASFLDNLLKVLQTNLNQFIRMKQKKNVLVCALKVLTQVLMKSKPPQNRNNDVTRNMNIPNWLLTLLKGFLKIQNGKQYIEIINDIVKLVGLLQKSSFQKGFGIEITYLRFFVPIMPQLVKTAVGVASTAEGQTLVTNLLRTTGIFANNASTNYIRSFAFYRDIVEKRFIQSSMQIGKAFEQQMPVIKLFVQVLSAFMHPVYGDIECFPWKRENSPGVKQYKESITMLQCVRQTIINTLLQANYNELFNKVLMLNDESAILPKISVYRICLQSIRQSKQFTEYLLFQDKMILKNVFLTLASSDQVVYGTVCQIIAQLIKYCKQKKKEKNLQSLLLTSFNVIVLKFKEISKGLLYPFGSLLVLQELVGLDNVFFNKILQQIGNDKLFFKNLSELIGNPQANKIEEMRKIQGSNYGMHINGLYDPIFLFLHRLIVRLAKEQPKKHEEIIRLIQESKLQVKIQQILMSLSPKTDLSPRGLISLLMFLYDVFSVKIWDQFADEGFFQSLVNLLKEGQIQAMMEWPQSLGGGQVCVTTMFGNLMKIFLVYLQQAQKQPQILKIIYQNKLLQLVIHFTKYLSADSIGSVITFILHLMSYDKPETKQSNSFVKQFTQSNGMSIFIRFQLLKSTQESATSIIQSCNLLSQIARPSKQFYEYIDEIEPFEDLQRLVLHKDVQVRSRVLNLIGNMCRHSNFFYKKIQQSGILGHCISLCEDNDKTIKKFACVAIGNASFHDDSLYDSLKASIPILVGLLKDTQEKTRSNAAAALGNLARNSHALDKQFINSGVNYQIINMLNNDKSISAKKVAVMAIINLLQLPQSRKILVSQQIGKILQKLLLPPLNTDGGLNKSVQKALEKLK